MSDDETRTRDDVNQVLRVALADDVWGSVRFPSAESSVRIPAGPLALVVTGRAARSPRPGAPGLCNGGDRRARDAAGTVIVLPSNAANCRPWSQPGGRGFRSRCRSIRGVAPHRNGE